MDNTVPGIIASGLAKAWSEDITSPVFDGIHMEVRPGEFIGICGPNGVGKTTLLYVLSKLEQPDQGKLSYVPASSKCRSAFVFQDYRGSLFNWLTVLENIGISKYAPGERARSTLCQEIEESLAECGLISLMPLLSKYPYELSGGQCQLVALARALFGKPNLLFLDEPFSALDVENRRVLITAIQELWCKRKPTTFIISHEIDDVLLTAQRLLVVAENPMRIVGEWTLPWPLPRKQSLILDTEYERIQREVKTKIFLGEYR